MKCQKCEELLSEYIDERLDAETAAEVAAHLAECRPCAESESRLRATIALVGGLERKTAPLDFGELAAARLERRMLLDGEGPAAKRRIISPWRFTGIGVLAAAVILVVCYVMTPPVDEKSTASYDRVDMRALDTDFSGGMAVEREKTKEISDEPAMRKDAGKVSLGFEEKAEQAARQDVRDATANLAAGRREADASGVADVASPPAPAATTLARTESGAFSLPAVATEDDKATVTTLAPEEAAQLKSLGYIGEGEKRTAAESAPVAVAVDSGLMKKSGDAPADGVTKRKAMLSGGGRVAPVTIEFDGDVNAPVKKLISLLADKGAKADIARERLAELSASAPAAGAAVAGDEATGKRDSLDELAKSASAAGVTIVEISADRAVVEFGSRPDRASEITAALKQAFTPVAKAPVDAMHVEGYVIEGPTTKQPEFIDGGLSDRAAGEEKTLVVTRIVFARRSADAKEESTP